MASAEEAGVVIIDGADTQENRVKELFRAHTSLVSQAVKTPAGANNQALPYMAGSPYKVKRIILSFKSDATDIAESEESDVQLPVTFLNERTMQPEFTQVLTLADFTGFTPAGTVDITCTAATKQRLCYYDAPTGYVATLGAGQKWHAYIGDDTA